MKRSLRRGVLPAIAIMLFSSVHGGRVLGSEDHAGEPASGPARYSEVLERARAGEPDAQFAIAVLLEYNCIDRSAAGGLSNFSWYILAADNGHAASALKVAEYDLYSGEPDAEPLRGIEALQKFVDKGEPKAKERLARELDRGVFVDRDIDRAKRLFVEAAEAGISDAAYYLAGMHAEAGESEEAIRWFEKAVELGNVAAMRVLARIYLYGTFAGVETEIDKPRYRFLISAAENATIARDREREAYEPCVF